MAVKRTASSIKPWIRAHAARPTAPSASACIRSDWRSIATAIAYSASTVAGTYAFSVRISDV